MNEVVQKLMREVEHIKDCLTFTGIFIEKVSICNNSQCKLVYNTRKQVKVQRADIRVKSPALGSDDLSLDQSATSIQILLQSRDTVLIKL